ncbi:MAG TPA: NAD(+) diphosphatase [Thermoanaerobaculia bacterium]|jgi:NAD+ diphosphatase
MIPFTGSPLDRSAIHRDDLSWIASRLSDPLSRIVGVREGKLLVREGNLHSVEWRNEPAVFLGVDADDVAWFAVESTAEETDGGTFEEMRPLATTLPPEEVAIAGVARSLFEWHRRHGFCAVCGNATDIISAGWKRLCPKCGAEHFPRVDPVVIMLPVLGDRCLLARNPGWPKGRMAPLAGFIEPGESIEEACAREMAEEASLVATKVTYMASQPWPFPSSLMFGLIAEVADENAVADGVELEEVRWLSREEARAVLAGRHPDVLAPNRYAIAHHLLTSWSAG